MATLTQEQAEALLGEMQKTADKISDKQSADPKTDDAGKTKPIGKVVHFPTITDVEEKDLRLAATISGTIYDAPSRSGWETMLNKIPGIQSAFPASDDKQLYVRFLDEGVKVPGTERLNLKTPFAAVISGETMVLGWRGTFGLFDVLADISFNTAAPWVDLGYPDLLAQGSFWTKVKNDLDDHRDQIVNYIKGHYMRDLNKPILDSGPDGIAIKRILLTGHSLGGGLAQLAHVALTLPNDDKDSLSSIIKEHEVEVRTLAVSAPMSIALSNSTSSSTADFLKEMSNKMHNFVFSMDIVPRGYANLTFINSTIDALADSIDNEFVQNFIEFYKRIMANKEEAIAELTKYRHMGKLVYYSSAISEPKVLTDEGFPGSDEEGNFYSIKYKAPEEDVVGTALAHHMGLAMAEWGPGMAYTPAFTTARARL